MKYINPIQRTTLLLILLTAGWVAGWAATQKEVNVVPDPQTNLKGDWNEDATAMQPLTDFEATEAGVTFAFDKGSGSYVPAYYINGKNIRLYKGNTFTVSLPSGDTTVEKIIFNCTKDKFAAGNIVDGYGDAIPSDAAALTYTWTNSGNAARAQFSIAANQVRITSVTFLLSVEGEEPAVNTYTAYFENDQGWKTVGTWIWDEGSGNNYTGGVWPGAECELVEVGDRQLWRYYFTTENTLITPKIIFNDFVIGGSQTEDLTFVNNGIYNYSGYTGSTVGGDVEQPLLKPVFSVKEPSFSETFALELSDPNEGWSSIYYTLDGSTPTESNGTLYTGPITIQAGSDVTVKAVVVYDGRTSAVATITYVYVKQGPQTYNVYFDNASGWNNVYAYIWDYLSDVKYAGDFPGSPCRLVMVDGKELWSYTFTVSQSLPKGMIVFNNTEDWGYQTPDCELINNGIYTAGGYTGNNVAEGAVITSPVYKPTISKQSCLFFEQFTVEITDNNGGNGEIRYTLDGSDPGPGVGYVYSSPITVPVGADLTLKAVAIVDGNASEIVSATYTYQQRYKFNVVVNKPGGLSSIYVQAGSDYSNYYGNVTLDVRRADDVYFQLSTNTGYKLTSFDLQGATFNSQYSRTGSFTMPANDVTLTVDLVYDPTSPADPDAPTIENTYTLTLVANPVGAASLSGKGKKEAGQKVSVSASARSGYKFVNWTRDGQEVSTSRSFTYTMPASDAVLTANFVYNPSNPGDPTRPEMMYPLTVVVTPPGAASYSKSAEKVEEGKNYSVSLYLQDGYKLKGWLLNGEPQETTSTYFNGVMTETGAQLVALCQYDPSSPSNPGANHYDPVTGQLIIDDFTPGKISDAINEATDYNYDNVSAIIVKGKMTESDLLDLRYLRNVSTIDISRVGGITEIPYDGFWSTPASSILLPSSVTKFSGSVFGECSNLISLTVYAQEPPVCTSNTFYDFPNKENCTVYVPASAVPLYEAAEYWKEFTILPITDDAHVLQVNLPADASDGRYKNNSIELVNLNSGVRQKYVVSDRLLYTFNGVRKDEQYNVYMLSQAGLEIGRIENITMPDEDYEVTFADLKPVYEVTVDINNQAGDDLSKTVTVEWFKPLADGTNVFLRKSPTLGEVPEGQTLICRVSLDAQLSALYQNPEDHELTVSADHNRFLITLVPYETLTVTGKVVDADGSPLADATVLANQMLNGKAPKSYTTKTDKNGLWTLTIFDVPQTQFTYSGTECVSLNEVMDAFEPSATPIDLGEKKLRSIVGARVTYGFTYRAAGAEEAENHYPDYQNVALSVYNITQDRAHSEVSLQYPLLVVLDENINTGDQLKLTASSKTGGFAPMEKIVTVDENQRANVTFDIIGKGGIEAIYNQTDNPAVVGMLYSPEGDFVKKLEYSDRTATFTDLDDGNYTLITMCRSEMMNSVNRLSLFESIGLTEGQEYVKNEVTVQRGLIAQVVNQEIPAFDESLYTYTSSSTSFGTNKSSVTTGNYLTLRSTIDFKSAYSGEVSDVTLVVTLPKDCDFVAQSVIQGSDLLSYTQDERTITIPLGSNYGTQTRFCVIPTTGGQFNASAAITFKYNGSEVTQPIGTAVAEVKELEILVPAVVASKNFSVTGTAKANSQIAIFDGDTNIGAGKANSFGTWNADCSLVEPENMSTHPISARITTPDGSVLNSEVKMLTYDRESVMVSQVRMYHDNPEMRKTYEIVYDFLNPNVEPQHYIYYIYNKKFTFTIDFTTDSPEDIANVVLWVKTGKGNQIPLDAFYSQTQKRWVAMGEFGNMYDGDIPVNVSVDFDALTGGRISRTSFTEANFDYDSYHEEIAQVEADAKALEDSLTDGIPEDFEQQFEDLYGAPIATDAPDYSAMTHDELAALVEENVTKSEQLLDENNPDNGWMTLLTKNQYGVADLAEYGGEGTVEVKETGDLTPELLLERGFDAMELEDGSIVYQLVTETSYEAVDFVANTYSIYTFPADSQIAELMRKASSATISALIEKGNEFETKVKEFVGLVSNMNDALDKVPDVLGSIVKGLDNQIAHNRELYQALRKELPNLSPEVQARDKEWIEELIQKNCKLGQQKRLLNATIKKLGPAISRVTAAVSALCDTYTTATNFYEYIDLWYGVPHCSCNPEKTNALRGEIAGAGVRCLIKDIANVGADIALLYMAINSAAMAPATGGQSLWVTLTSIGFTVAKNMVNDWSNGEFAKERARFRAESNALGKDKSCSSCPDDEKQNPDTNIPPKPTKPGKGNNGNGKDKNKNGGAHQSGNPDTRADIDPSGYVYEAVPDNRVEGVQATIYYKETKTDMYGDLYEEEMIWNAEEHAQRNPLFTDENGMYRWDVPQGLWQVRFEKDGYIPTQSEWLPVPPPQLDVNIGIVQNKQPEVTEAHAYEEGVEVQFDKFMDPATLTTANIFVTAGDEKINGSISLISESAGNESAQAEAPEAPAYVSRVRFVPEIPLSVTTGEVRITVSRNVLSYAGIPMTETFTQVLDIEKEVQAIEAKNVKVLYGGEKVVTIFAKPFDAAVGRKLNIENSSDLVASLDFTQTTFDDEGKAVVTVKGELPGRSQLTFSIPDVTVKGECAVDVVTEIITAEAPEASRADGSAVYRGTKVELTTDSESGVIYFTTDGTSPDIVDGSRRKYTVPIIINEDTKIIALTSVGSNEGDNSEIVEFNYTLKRSNMDFAMPQGWTWISHNFDEPIAPSELAADEGVQRIMGQTHEVVRDPELGLVGLLQEMNASESYKVETSAATARQRLSDVEWNPATPIAIKAGWNWLGYPVAQTMSVAEAFAPTDCEEGDAIVGQSGFAKFDGEAWVGTLEVLTPGQGYMYQSVSEKDVVYNTSIVSNAAAHNVPGISENSALALDIHKYPSVMPVIATLMGKQGEELDNYDYQVNAFCGTECRGIGRVIDGLVMMNVYGNPGDEITFRVADAAGSNEYANNSQLQFSERIVGELNEPYAIAINDVSGIGKVNYEGNVKVSVAGDMLLIKGIAAEDVDLVELYDIEGHKLLHESNYTEAGIRISHLTTGVYVVIVTGNGDYTYHKIALR